MPAGRPTDYNLEIAERICEALVLSDQGLERLCNETDDFPTGRTAWNWVAAHDEFFQMVTRAKERQYERMMHDGVVEIQMVDPDSRYGTARVGRAKALADATFKLAEKMLSKRFGAAVDVNVGGQPGRPVQTQSIDHKDLPESDRKAIREIHRRKLQAELKHGGKASQ